MQGWAGCGCAEPGSSTHPRSLLRRALSRPSPLPRSLKKFAKNVGGATNEPVPGFVTLEIEHPDDPGLASSVGL